MRVTPEAIRDFLKGLPQGVEGAHCAMWQGPVTKHGVPMLLHENEVEVAARFAYAWGRGLEETPSSNVGWSCGERRCVNPEHVELRAAGRTGRRKLSLPETAHYQERKDLVKSVLKVAPNTKFEELRDLLKGEKLGGNTNILSLIVREARAELKLPLRVPPGPKPSKAVK